MLLAGQGSIYRFDHPEKTETQLFLDTIKGKIFERWYSSNVTYK